MKTQLNWLNVGLAVIAMAIGLLLLPEKVYTAACESNGSGNWSNSSTWTNCGDNYPGQATNDAVTIKNGHIVTLDTSPGAISNLVIESGGQLTFSGVQTLKLSAASGSPGIANSGTFDAGSGTVEFNTDYGSQGHSVSGTITFNNVTITGVSVDFGSSSTVNGTLQINGGGSVNANPPTYGSASTLKYNSGGSYDISNEWKAGTSQPGMPYNVEIASGWLQLYNATEDRTALGNITINVNCSLMADFDHDLFVGGSWTNNGSFTHNNRTVTFNGHSGTQTISGSTIFYNLTFDNSGATTDFGTSLVTVGHDLTKDAGSMEPGTGTIYLSGAAGSIRGSGAKYFYDLVIYSWANISNSSGGDLHIEHNFTNSGTFTQASARETTFNGSTQSLSGGGTTTFGSVTIQGESTLNAGSHNLTITGSSFQVSSGGTFNGGTATVTFGGSPTTIGGTGMINFNNVTISNALTGRSSGNINVAGNWTNNGTFNHNSGTVTFNGTTAISGSATNSFNNVTISGSLTGPSGNMNVAGNWTNNGTFTANSGKVTFNKSGSSTISGSSTTFYDLEINANTTLDVGTNPLFDATNSVRNYGALKQTQTIGTDNAAFLNVSSGKYYGVEIDPEGPTSMGSTTVTIHGEQTCPSPPSLGDTPVKRCYEISPGTQTAATIKFWYDDTYEKNTNTPANVDAYHQKSGLWYKENGSYNYESSGGFQWVSVTGVDEFSPFGLNDNPGPTLIDLASFTATPHDGYVLVQWETASEMDNAGFNLWRGEAEAGPYTQLNANLIPARGGPTTGASYGYNDERLTNGMTYWYKLEDVDIHGVSAFHGPVSATPQRLHRFYLPLFLREGRS